MEVKRKQVGDPVRMSTPRYESKPKAKKRRSKPGKRKNRRTRIFGNGCRRMPCARGEAGKRDMRRVPTKRNELRIFAEGGALESSSVR